MVAVNSARGMKKRSIRHSLCDVGRGWYRLRGSQASSSSRDHAGPHPFRLKCSHGRTRKSRKIKWIQPLSCECPCFSWVIVSSFRVAAGRDRERERTCVGCREAQPNRTDKPPVLPRGPRTVQFAALIGTLRPHLSFFRLACMAIIVSAALRFRRTDGPSGYFPATWPPSSGRRRPAPG